MTTEIWFTARSQSKRRLVSENSIKILDIYVDLMREICIIPHHHHQMEEVEVQESV